MSDIMLVIQGLIKMVRIFGSYGLLATICILAGMILLKQWFGISTKKLVYSFLNKYRKY